MNNTEPALALPHWDMSVIYPDLASAEFQQAFDSAVANIAELQALFDRHDVRRREALLPLDDTTVQAVEEVIARFNVVLEATQRISAYINAFVTTNSRDTVAQGKASAFQKQLVPLRNLSTRFIAWVGTLDVAGLIPRSEVARGHAYLLQRAQVQAAWLDYQRALAAYDARMKPSNAQMQQALAALASAKNLLAKLQPTADDLTAAQANVNAAQAGRDLIAEQVKNGKLTAPFAGTVTTMDLKSGEFVAPGAAVLRLADTSNFQVETTDLTELNIVNIREGDAVTVSFDAIPSMELAGKVKQIKGYGENRQGDIVYTLVITLDKQDERLRWNMTSKVTLAAKQ